MSEEPGPPVRTILVTGATSGIGGAVARRLVRRGDRVVAIGRRGDRLRSLAEEFGPDRVHPIALDVRDQPRWDAALSSLPTAFAAVDVLVNNAGLALGMEPAQVANVEEWEQMIDTNCKGVVFAARAVLPGMVARRRGHIINLGSTAGSYPYPGGNVYGATKAFVHQFTLNLRSDLAGTGVRATCVEPGLCGATEFSEVRFRGDQARAAAVYAGTQPLVAEDVAAVIEWVSLLPDHVNVNTIELMPVDQTFAPLAIRRTS